MSNYPGIYGDDPQFRNITMTNHIIESVVDNLTALAGGGQSASNTFQPQNARFSTVATTGDSATLRKSLPGLVMTISNAGANSMNVFPYVGDAINALSVNAAFAIPAGKTCQFICYSPGIWHSLLSA